jgi:hypothetical protein
MFTTPGRASTPGRISSVPSAAAVATPARGAPVTSPAASLRLPTSPAPPAVKRGRAASPLAAAAAAAAAVAPPALRGLPAAQPALWARVFFTPEGGSVDTRFEPFSERVMAHIAAHFDVPAHLPVPLSGLTGEERIRIAYYQGALVAKGAARALLCSKCGEEGHAPLRCTAP